MKDKCENIDCPCCEHGPGGLSHISTLERELKEIKGHKVVYRAGSFSEMQQDRDRLESDDQLKRWAAGESIHRGSRTEGECCPDFSCCNDKMNTPKEEREAFLRADEAARMAMLMTFLGRALAGYDKKVYIAGDETNYQEPS